MSGTLEVRIIQGADAGPAERGGADRLELVGSLDDGGMAPEPRLVAEVRRRTSLELRPMLRLREGFGTDGGEVSRLKGLAAAYLSAGADGLTVGFINRIGDVDRDVIVEVLAETGCPWTFHRGFDTALDTDRAWEDVRHLPKLDTVRTAGSARTVEHGLDDLVRRAKQDPALAALMMAAGELQPDQVPWLARAGITKFHVSQQVRPGGSWKAYVDEPLVRSWRRLIDQECAHAGR